MNVGKTAWLLAFILFFGNPFAADTAHARAFTDVGDNHWAAEGIRFLSDRGVISGYSDGRFGVNDRISRAEAAAMIIRSLGWGSSGWEDPGYPDVSPNHWAYNEIAAMKANGFFAPAGRFEPRKPVTRAEMADMIVKTFDLASTSGYRFTDVNRDHPNYDAIVILAANAITVGYDDGSFRPDGEVTRAEFAVFLSRALDERFRAGWNPEQAASPVIYDVEIGGTVHQLENPMRLKGTWLAPAEFYRNMGFTVERGTGGLVHLTTADGVTIEVAEGEQETWVGDTLVSLKVGHVLLDGELYVEAGNLLRALERPMVFYPDKRLIRIEAPRITAGDIAARAPETVIRTVHDPMPYWQWTKRDHDYLLRMARQGAANRDELLQEMVELTEAYFAAEREKNVVRGLHYYDDHLTGKLDALSRGLEARYVLLHEPDRYAYPAIGKSGALSVFGYMDNLQHQYTVADYSFDHYAGRKKELIRFIESNDELPFGSFRGLAVIGAPFTIVEKQADGSTEAFAGKAVGSHYMLVSGSNLSTFIHEFGHNWDSVYGDHETYLSLRGKSGYVPSSSAWEARIEENFAEDFTQAFLPEDLSAPHKAVFGTPNEAELQAFKAWTKTREREIGEPAPAYMTVNGASVVPDVWVQREGSLHLAGVSGNVVHVLVKHEETGQVTEYEIPSHGKAYEQTIELPAAGRYRVQAGTFNFTVLVMP